VLDLDRFDGVAEHLFLNLTVGLSEAVMLPLVFRPRVDFEALQVCIRCFCIDEDPPAYCAIRGENSLIVVDLIRNSGAFAGSITYFTVTRTGPWSGSGSSIMAGLTQ